MRIYKVKSYADSPIYAGLEFGNARFGQKDTRMIIFVWPISRPRARVQGNRVANNMQPRADAADEFRGLIIATLKSIRTVNFFFQ